MGDLDFDAILSTQLTVGVLSHSVPSGVCLVLTWLNATLTASTSAASSKSELVSRQFGMSVKTTSRVSSAKRSGGAQRDGGSAVAAARRLWRIHRHCLRMRRRMHL